MLGVCRNWAILEQIYAFLGAAWGLLTIFFLFGYFPVENMPNRCAIPDMPPKFFSSYSMPSKLATSPIFVRFWPFWPFLTFFWHKFDLIWLIFQNNRWSSLGIVKLHREKSFSTGYWQFWAILTPKKSKKWSFLTISDGCESSFWPVLALSHRIFAPWGEYFELKWCITRVFFEIYTCKNIFDFSLRKSLEL